MKTFSKKIAEKWRAFTGRFLRFTVAPHRQFKRLMVATLVLAVVLVVSQVYLFTRVENRTVFGAGTVTTAPAPVVNEAKLALVLQKFQDRALLRASALQLVPAVAEPSR